MSTMRMKKLPVGISDFKKIIEDNYFYVDKTLFIKDVIIKAIPSCFSPVPAGSAKPLIFPW